MKNFNKIYNDNYKWVHNLIKSRTSHSQDSEELANDVFMKVHNHLSNYDEDKCQTGLVGWIRSIVWNTIIDYYRKKKLDVQSIEAFKDDDGKEIFSIKDETDIESEYCTRELIDNAKDVIKMLPNPYKTIATLFYIKDCTYDEIVQETGLSIGTIKGQLNRARNKMRTEFGVA